MLPPLPADVIRAEHRGWLNTVVRLHSTLGPARVIPAIIGITKPVLRIWAQMRLAHICPVLVEAHQASHCSTAACIALSTTKAGEGSF